MALNVHEVANGDDDLLDLLGQLTGGSKDKSLALLQVGVDLLQNGDGESSGLASTGLGLSNDIVAWRGNLISFEMREEDLPNRALGV